MTGHISILSLTLVLVSLTPLSSSRSQTQNTLGACSPAVARVQGNVSITCVMPDQRIRVAKYSGPIDHKNYKKFSGFIANNLNKLIRIEVTADPEYIENERIGDRAGAIVFKSQDCETCGGHGFSIRESAQSEPSIVYQNGYYSVQGYFIPRQVIGMWQGWVFESLAKVDDNQVILSGRYVLE